MVVGANILNPNRICKITAKKVTLTTTTNIGYNFYNGGGVSRRRCGRKAAKKITNCLTASEDIRRQLAKNSIRTRNAPSAAPPPARQRRAGSGASVGAR